MLNLIHVPGDVKKFAEVNMANRKNECARCVACMSVRIWSHVAQLGIMTPLYMKGIQLKNRQHTFGF